MPSSDDVTQRKKVSQENGRLERPDGWPDTISPQAEMGNHLAIWNPNAGAYVCVCGYTQEEP